MAGAMGHARSLSTTTAPARQGRRFDPGAHLRRGLDLLVGSALLLLALPLMAVLALVVRHSSHGPVLHREPALDRHGRRIELLSFRTAVDGAGTVHHARVRAVVGGADAGALTSVGRLIRAMRADRLPRLINVVAGHRSLLGG